MVVTDFSAFSLLIERFKSRRDQSQQQYITRLLKLTGPCHRLTDRWIRTQIEYLNPDNIHPPWLNRFSATPGWSVRNSFDIPMVVGFDCRLLCGFGWTLAEPGWRSTPADSSFCFHRKMVDRPCQKLRWRLWSESWTTKNAGDFDRPNKWLVWDAGQYWRCTSHNKIPLK